MVMSKIVTVLSGTSPSQNLNDQSPATIFQGDKKTSFSSLQLVKRKAGTLQTLNLNKCVSLFHRNKFVLMIQLMYNTVVELAICQLAALRMTS